MNPVDKWVYMCTSMSSSGSQALVNTQDNSYCSSCKYAWEDKKLFVVNPANGETSNFGIAEMIVWNRALTPSELDAARDYLSATYGFDLGIRSAVFFLLCSARFTTGQL